MADLDPDTPIIYGECSFGMAQASDGRWFTLGDVAVIRDEIYGAVAHDAPPKKWHRVNSIETPSDGS